MFDPRLFCISRKLGGGVGAIGTGIDEIWGRGGPDLFLKAHCFSDKRYGKLKVQEKSLLRAGMEVAQEKDSSVTLAQEAFTKNLRPLPTSPGLREGRREPLSLGETKMRQCNLG